MCQAPPTLNFVSPSRAQRRSVEKPWYRCGGLHVTEVAYAVIMFVIQHLLMRDLLGCFDSTWLIPAMAVVLGRPVTTSVRELSGGFAGRFPRDVPREMLRRALLRRRGGAPPRAPCAGGSLRRRAPFLPPPGGPAVPPPVVQ